MSQKTNRQTSVEALQAQADRIQERIRAKTKTDRKAVLDQVVRLIQLFAIPVDEIDAEILRLEEIRDRQKLSRTRKQKRPPVLPKYRDPDSGTQWSGRGREPAWIQGKDRRDFLIRK